LTTLSTTQWFCRILQTTPNYLKEDSIKMEKKFERRMEIAPDTYSELTSSIAAEYESLSRQLKKFGRFALDNSDTLALETVTTVAEKADVQPSTIVRFAKAFGFDGFSDMQQVFRTRLVENNSSYRERIHSLQNDEGRDGVASVLDNFTHTGIESLEQLKLNTPVAKLNQAVEILKNARHVHLLGHRRASAVIHYLHYALSQLDISCMLADGASGMLQHQMNRVGPEDAVLAVSFTPYTPVVAEMVALQSEKGHKIVSITDSPLSPLASRSTVSFEIQDGRDQAFRTLVAPICLAQCLVVGIGQLLENEQTS